MIIGSIEFLVQFYHQTFEEGGKLPLHFAGVIQLSTGCLSKRDNTCIVNKLIICNKISKMFTSDELLWDN